MPWEPRLPNSPHEPVSVAVMAHILGYRDPRDVGRRRLLKEINQRERETGERIATVLNEGARSALRVNVQSMRRFFPEKFRRAPEDFAKEARKYTGQIEQRLSGEQETLAAELRRRMDDLESGLLELASELKETRKKLKVAEITIKRLMDRACVGPVPIDRY